jgi:glucose/arabinose dehydrogenase
MRILGTRFMVKSFRTHSQRAYLLASSRFIAYISALMESPETMLRKLVTPLREIWRQLQRLVCAMCMALAGLLTHSACSAPAGTVIGWGSVSWFDLTPPTNLTNAVAATVGEENCLALTSAGTVVGWGNGNDLGAASPPSGLSNVVAIASGAVHSLALKADGKIVGWGDNNNGQTSIPPILTNVTAIAAGGYHSLALTRNGQVWAWGAVGQDTNVIKVPASLTNVIAIAAGGYHSLAVRNDGTVVAWGADDNGQCDVPPGLIGVVTVAANANASLALTTNGDFVAWGNGATNYPIGLTNIVAIATGCEAAHFLALRNDGMVLGWGDNTFGPLNGPAPYTNLVAITTGYGVSFGITLEPVITQQPADTSGLAGTNLSLSVGVVGASLWNYQWFRGTTNLAGQTNSTLALVNVQVSDSDSYSVLVSNHYGAVPSSPANVTVQPFPPSVTTQPTNQVQVAGATATFAVAAAGAPPLSYQWYFNNGVMSGVTNSVLTLTNVNDLNAGIYQVVVSNVYGTAISAQVVLTVNDPPAITSTLASLTLPAGTNWILSATVTGNQTFFYQWQFQGGNIHGATNLSMVLANIQFTNAGLYALCASNQFGVVTDTLYSIVVVDSPPVIYQQPISGSFLPGGEVALPVLAYGSAPLFSQWWFNGSAISGATNLLLRLMNLQPTNAGAYFLTLSNAFGFTNTITVNLSVSNPYPGKVDWPLLGFTQAVSNTFNHPVVITHAGDNSARLFVAEQSGRIWIVQGNSVVTQPFLNIIQRVLSLGAEQGLLGLAFPPGFSTNNHFYVDYTRQTDGAVVISRFFLTSTNSNVADTNSEQVVMTIPKPYNNHNAGQLAFGPDGDLYIGVGDGGSEGDPLKNGQKTSTLLGKLLRIDVEGGGSPYAVPPDNPFVGNTNYSPEIWALGLRNPWRFSFDRLTGDLYIGDVGQNRYEEIDFQPAGSAGGQNYGWRIMEGPSIYSPPPGFTNFSALTPPVVWYTHSSIPAGGSAAVIGGYVYRGPSDLRMDGIYLYGDFMAGWVWASKQFGTNWQSQILLNPAPPASHFWISAFGEDDTATLYLADYYNGIVYQINDSYSAFAPVMSPDGGSFNNDQNVVVSTVTPGAMIHYTTDGRDPSEFDPAVSSGSAIPVGATMTLKLRAYRADLSPSAVTAANFSFQVVAPAFTPNRGPITNGTSVAISSATSGATLHYTLNGSYPTLSSTTYTAPLLINGNTTLQAIGIKPGYQDSGISSVFFDWTVVPTPEISPVSGAVITNGTLASIACVLPSGQIHYTTDGTVPTQASPLYTGPFPFFGNSTLNAAAWADNYAPSQMTTANYGLLNYESTVVQTYAGQSQAGFTNGLRLQAEFNAPQGVCVDPSGNVYVADTGNNVIREILTNSQVVTVAGSGTPGSADGIGTNASFSAPTGVALDGTGNLYVADSGHNLLRKILSDGTVTTLANLAYSPYQLPVLWQLVINTNGTVYVGGLLEVFAVNQDGTFSNFAGPGYCCPPDWSTHIGLALDNAGGLFATINANTIAAYGRIVELSPGGGYNIYAGDSPGYTDGPRQIAQFQKPLDLARYTDGGLIVSDTTRVRKIATNGNVSTLAGIGQFGYQNGPGIQAAFTQLGAVAVDASGNIYVADSGNNCIREISSDTDGIGIPDWWQLAHFGFVGIDPNADTDHDGMSNFAEFLADTDPNSTNSCLRINSVQVQSGGMFLNWSGGPNSFEYVQRSSSLGGTNVWQDIFTNPPSLLSGSSYIDSSATNGTYYYRIRVGWQ